MDGWIKLHRKILENPIVCKDSEYFYVWCYLLLNATHKERKITFNGKQIILQPGELLTGRKSISEKLKINESKVQRILKAFENEHQIEQQTTNKNRLVKIVLWNTFQSDEQQNAQLVNNKRTTNEQPVNTNKKVKKEENVIIKHKCGAYAHVLLKDSELEKLNSDYGEEETKAAIEYLDEYIEMKGTKYKNHYLVLRRWVFDAIKKQSKENSNDINRVEEGVDFYNADYYKQFTG